MPDLIITDDLLDRCAVALFAVDCRTVRPDQSWRRSATSGEDRNLTEAAEDFALLGWRRSATSGEDRN